MKLAGCAVISMFCILGCFWGCQPGGGGDTAGTTTQADSHGHGHDHDHPESLQEAVETLSGLYAKIKTAFESGDPDAAHGELHEVGHLLEEDFPTLIKKEDSLDADSKSKLESVVSALFDEFFKLDDMMHGGENVDFATLEPVISAALDELKSVLP